MEKSKPPLPLKQLEKKIAVKFRDADLLEEALTHKSFFMGAGNGRFNERLEFLGDSILNTSVTDYLFRKYPKDDEGKLSKWKSQLVSRASLMDWGRELNIGSYLRMSEAESQSGGRERDSLLANSVEALIGALYLDQGFEQAKSFVLRKFMKKKRIIETDFKSKLQEIVQKKFGILPVYAVTREMGPDHDKTFHMEVRVKKKLMGEGTGKSKKEAQQNAARCALKSMSRASNEDK